MRKALILKEPTTSTASEPYQAYYYEPNDFPDLRFCHNRRLFTVHRIVSFGFCFNGADMTWKADSFPMTGSLAAHSIPHASTSNTTPGAGNVYQSFCTLFPYKNIGWYLGRLSANFILFLQASQGFR